MKWNEPDENGLVEFLCGDRNFSEERIRNGAKKLAKAKGGATQGRLDSFFKVVSTTPAKRKVSHICMIIIIIYSYFKLFVI